MLTEFKGECLTVSGQDWHWRNHYVTTRGVIVSDVLHPSEEAAKRWADEFFAEWRSYQAGGGSLLVDLPDGSAIPFDCFRCALQVPVF